MPVKLLGLAVAVPPNVILQDDAIALCQATFAGRMKGLDQLIPVFRNAGIRERHSVQPLAWFSGPHGWAERMHAFAEGASALFLDVAPRAIRQAGLEPEAIDGVVFVSSTGFAVPSIEARAAREIGFRPDIERVPIFGLGCAGGVSGLAIAARLAAARPGRKILFVAIELCTLAFRADEPSKVSIVASALFGDGAAACVLSAEDGGIAAVEASGDHLFPDTPDVMGWRVDDAGLGIVLAQSLPHFVASEVGPAVAGMLGRNGIAIGEVDRFVCHPGGGRVLDALEHALSLGQGALNDEREVLADYGNMSSPTVLFVLDRAIRAGLPRRSAMIAMGPGFTASCLTLKRAA